MRISVLSGLQLRRIVCPFLTVFTLAKEKRLDLLALVGTHFLQLILSGCGQEMHIDCSDGMGPGGQEGKKLGQNPAEFWPKVGKTGNK